MLPRHTKNVADLLPQVSRQCLPPIPLLGSESQKELRLCKGGVKECDCLSIREGGCRAVASSFEIKGRLLARVRLLEVVGQNAGEFVQAVFEQVFDRLANKPVEVLAPGAQKRAVGSVSQQRVPECIVPRTQR